MNGYAHLVKIKGQWALYKSATPRIDDLLHPIGYYEKKREAREASENLGLKPWNF